MYYYEGIYVKKHIIKGIDYFQLSSKNGYAISNFILGFIYQEGKSIKQDIKKSIAIYKNLSSFNNNYAKNNLGVIYKDGFKDLIPKNIEYAKIYLQEAINQKNDSLAIYNLANIYFFEDNEIDKSIELLIKKWNYHFYPSYEFLSLLLIKKIGFNIELIETELTRYCSKIDLLYATICEIINFSMLENKFAYDSIYHKHINLSFLYNHKFEPISTHDLYKCEPIHHINHMIKDINKYFYDGFENNS